jgi:hypothetical protein
LFWRIETKHELVKYSTVSMQNLMPFYNYFTNFVAI